MVEKDNSKIKCRSIYKVVSDFYFTEEELFPKESLLRCKIYSNIPQTIPYGIKYKIKKLAIEEGLYSRVLMIRHQNEVNPIEEGSSKKITSNVFKANQ